MATALSVSNEHLLSSPASALVDLGAVVQESLTHHNPSHPTSLQLPPAWNEFLLARRVGDELRAEPGAVLAALGSSCSAAGAHRAVFCVLQISLKCGFLRITPCKA